MNVLEADQLSQHDLWSILEVVTNGVWRWDIVNDQVYWSPALLKLFGYADSLARLEDIFELTYPEDRDRLSSAIDEAIQTTSRFEVDVRLKSADGTYRWIQAWGSVKRDSVGKPESMQGFVVDITDKIRQQEALRRSQDHFHGFMELCPAAVFIKDGDGRHLFVNPTTSEMVGMPVGEIVGKTHFEIFPPETANQLDSVDKMVLATGQERRWTGRIQRPDGTHRWVHDVKFPVLTEDGVQAIGGFGLDITELRNAQDAASALERLESIGRLAGGVAHDFNNMLSVILLSAGMAAREPDVSQNVSELLEEVLEAGNQGALITRQLLAFARKQDSVPVTIAIDERIDRAMSMLERLIGEDIRIVRLKSPYCWPVRLDPGQLEQVFTNICMNARDAIKGGGVITVETANLSIGEPRQGSHEVIPEGDHVLLRVRDTGCGMSEEALRHLFEPFFTTKRTGHGTGLGMASVFGIVKQNGGFIDVCSRPDAGTEVSIFLPRASVGEGGDPGGRDVPVQPGGGERILLVEDNSLVLRSTKNALSQLGYEIIEASTPGRALEIVREQGATIDLVVSDIIMPEMNGVVLTGEIRKIHQRMKVILTSGYSAGALSEKGVDIKNSKVLGKPLSIQQWAGEIRAILGQPWQE